MSRIERLTIKGFKSIRHLDRLELRGINVLIGANGSGKSNFISYFRMLGEMIGGRLQVWVQRQGGADRVLTFGVKETERVESFVEFGENGYRFVLEPTTDGRFVFAKELLYVDGPTSDEPFYPLGSGHEEARIEARYNQDPPGQPSRDCYEAIASWKVFHFHDTSDTAGVKRLGSVHDSTYLRSDASNLAAYLYRLHQESPAVLAEIRDTVRLAIPLFDDFVLKPMRLPTGEEQIRLLWRQRGSDYPFWPSQLSDGSIRFICLVTALLQPDPPATIIIDEPELGLHPYALLLLASLLRSASERMQVIVSTQSVPLINEFALDELIVVECEDGASVFRRLKGDDFAIWLEDYSVGELWEKNLLGGRPR